MAITFLENYHDSYNTGNEINILTFGGDARTSLYSQSGFGSFHDNDAYLSSLGTFYGSSA